MYTNEKQRILEIRGWRNLLYINCYSRYIILPSSQVSRLLKCHKQIPPRGTLDVPCSSIPTKAEAVLSRKMEPWKCLWHGKGDKERQVTLICGMDRSIWRVTLLLEAPAMWSGVLLVNLPTQRVAFGSNKYVNLTRIFCQLRVYSNCRRNSGEERDKDRFPKQLLTCYILDFYSQTDFVYVHLLPCFSLICSSYSFTE